MAQEDQDCTNPFVRAASRQYRLISGGKTFSGADDVPSDAAESEQPLHYFTNPFAKAADREYRVQTGHALVATQQDFALSGTLGKTPRLRKHHPDVLSRARRLWLNRLFRLPPKLRHVLPWAALSTFLYAGLFLNSQTVLEASTGHWWSFLVPVTIALGISFAHGNFSAAFWDAVGLKPNTVRN